MNLYKKKKKRNKKVDVTVIVPMYNVENLIADTIKCLKKNSCKLEILLIDDGSKDKTIQAALQAISGDERFKIIPKINSGVSDTRNIGIKYARGTYLFFSDSDDILADKAIDKLFFAAKALQADFVYGGIKKFNSEKIWTIPIHDKHKLFSEGEKNLKDNPELFFSMGPVAKLIHRSLLKGNLFPSEIQCAEDQVVLFNVFINARKIYSIGEYIYFYRERDITKNDMSITQQRDIKAFYYLSDIISVMNIIRKNLDNSSFSSEQKKVVLKQYYERALTFDVWPLFIRALKHNPKLSKETFRVVSKLLDQYDDNFINYVPGFRFFFLRMLVDYVDYIKIQDFLIYRKLIQKLISRLTTQTKDACYQYWGARWCDNLYLGFQSLPSAFIYFIKLRMKKRLFRFLNKNQETILKKYIFPFYQLFPINKNKIVFATSTKGKASSNFTFLLNELKKDKSKSYNIKKFLGLSNELTRNLSRYFHLATARVIILESYYKPLYGIKLNRKQKVLQLWHACGAFKKFGLSALGKADSNSLEFEKDAHKHYTHIVASSPLTGELYAEAFGTPMERVYSLGVPRTDLFFSKNKLIKIKKDILEVYPKLENTINILYAPTFRGSPSQRKNFEFLFDFNIFSRLPKNYKLIIKLHPVVDIKSIKIPKEYEENIILLESYEDVNNWMVFSDILITDYSSLIFEYAILNKPIIFYVPDLEIYFDERGGFYYPFEEYAYGKICQTEDDLVNSILTAKIDLGNYASVRERFKEKFMGGCNGKSSSTIYNKIIKDNDQN